MDELKIGNYGLILKGKHKDWYVFIEPLGEEGGSYLILFQRSLDPNDKLGYDNWVENYEDLLHYFKGWEIKWLDIKKYQ